jgi:GTP:adenosylcobinamide-phosphate guanylyltransferase
MENIVIDAVVLGGGNAKGLAQVPAKGLIPINGRPMVEYVLEALTNCDQIGRICVVMPVDYTFSGLARPVDVVVADGSLPAVAKAGLDFLGAKQKTLFLSADVPMISSESIADFLNRCKDREAAFYYPIVRFGESEKRFPDVKRTYAKVREGRFTGGNIALVEPPFVYRNMDFLQNIFELRKKPVKLVQVLGIMFLVKFILGVLRIKEIESRMEQLTGLPCAAIVTPYIEIGIDVDKESDLKLAMQAIVGGA